MRLPLVGQSYTTRSTTAAAQSCINLYPEPNEDPNERAKGIGALYGCPGRHVFKDLTTIDAAATPVRGVWSGGGRLFAAAGTKYMELNITTGALIGSVRTIADDGPHTPVQFFVNGNQLFIVSAGVCYVDNGAGPTIISLPALSGTVNTSGAAVVLATGDEFTPDMVNQPITINAVVYTVLLVPGPGLLLLSSSAGVQIGVAYSAAPVMSALTGAFLDGYFIVNRASRQFNISPINDGSNGGTYIWDQTDFGIKESYPDNIRGILVSNEQLYLFGLETGEVWQNTGNASFPFERIDGATFNIGIISSWSPIELNGRVYFLGTNSEGQISAYVMDGYTPVRLSTYALESAWNDGLAPTNAYSYGYVEEGHVFWVFHIGSQCWGYDTTTRAWHQRNAFLAGSFTIYPTYYHTFVAESSAGAGKHITGGTLDGKLYESSVNFYDDAGTDIKWQRTLPYMYEGGKRMYFGRNTLSVQTGTVPSGAAPNITRSYSDNRGQTFTGSQTASLGVHDNFSIRVFWPLGGSSVERLWRYEGTGQYKVAIVECDMDVEAGVN